MKFSVVGLPHYTVWHLYEPSVDDLRHMEEMDREKKARDKEEQERQDRAKKIQNEFNEPDSQWEKDKSELQNIAKSEAEKKKSEKGAIGDESGPISPPKDSTNPDDISAKKSAGKKTVEADNNIKDADLDQEKKLPTPKDLADSEGTEIKIVTGLKDDKQANVKEMKPESVSGTQDEKKTEKKAEQMAAVKDS